MKVLLYLSLILALLITLLGGCSPKPAQTGDIVRIDYTLLLEDGTIYDTSAEGEPLLITLGANSLPPAIEEAIIGMKAGEKKTLELLAADAFGPRYEELVIEVSKDELPPGVDPQVGMQLQSTTESGVINLAVIAVNETTVTFDANSPLAGHDITFEMELREIVPPGKADSSGSGAAPEAFIEAMENGLPSIVEFGSSTCVPCKQMKPILEELAVQYKGKVNVVIVEVYDYTELSRQYKIVGIPTQVFFDASGAEVFRNTGFFAKDKIINQFGEMGVK